MLYLQQRIQAGLPFNPTDVGNVVPTQAFETTISFVTNTNWQSYYPETTISHLTQMMGLTVQNFVSAAVGMAVMAALIRGLTRVGKRTVGNFWVDLVRTNLRILLPIAFVFALVLGAAASCRTSRASSRCTRSPARSRRSRAARSPARSRSSSSAPTAAGSTTRTRRHPFENPTPVSNFVELYVIC